MSRLVAIRSYILRYAESPLAQWQDLMPWQMTYQSEKLVGLLLKESNLDGYDIEDQIAVHFTTTVESGAMLKPPLILGPRCFVASGAYLRGGNWIESDCIFGPGAELKSSYMFAGSKLAHFNFVGDSILGERVNLEAGSIVCNYRNERPEKEIRIRTAQGIVGVDVDKFGALIGDGTRLGANAVVAPGALLKPNTVVRRTQLLDDEVES